ncbi:hypothetical protein [Moorena sp. SIO3H5]|uniref:hypothetical protein n=1 Tax=Moorena sp. SIO3H5 TaxID=2607834 RepID=UPI0013B88D46|nr:hypothetical protein [Moorena sp. SIO3H5]NEO69042.1 hypothetical protein [Moorena sp. SIO3H5]
MSIGRMMASVLTYHLALADGDKSRICLRWFKPWLKQLGMKNLGWWALVTRLRWKWFGIFPDNAHPTDFLHFSSCMHAFSCNTGVNNRDPNALIVIC